MANGSNREKFKSLEVFGHGQVVFVAALRTRIHSVLLKKNSLSYLIGPPIEYPN